MEEHALGHWAYDWLINHGLGQQTVLYIILSIDIFLVLLVSLIADFVARRLILGVVKSYVTRSKNTYDDVFLEKKVFQSLAHLLPAIIIWYSIPWIFDHVDFEGSFFNKAITIFMIIQVVVVMNRFLKALEYIGLRSQRFEGKPISSYVQVAKITIYIIGAILVLSMIIGKSPITILTAFGAATAVILLIFRDTILGLVASIQISANDMVRLGDWVTMEKYGADGDVMEINLTTVKVRNFDKTFTTVPTYSFIADSFKNWRGMQSMGVRRIKRSINIDIGSVKFVSEEMRDRFLTISRVKDFVISRQAEIDKFNADTGADKSILINGRHMTNLGVFRRYALQYLMDNPKIDQKETVMVRQLQPTETGLPLEIYAFSSDIAWVNYENIQADIFDHLLAAAEMFELRIFQNPSGGDFHYLGSHITE
jgi:miniconductance mechanosensitive channel